MSRVGISIVGLLFAAATLAFGQQVSSVELGKDAEEKQEIKEESKPQDKDIDPLLKGCTETTFSIADGAIVPKTPQKLKLQIIKLDKSKYTEGENIVAEVQLKNVGTEVVSIPFSPKEVEVDRTADETSYSSGRIDLSLETGDDGNSSDLYGNGSIEGSASTQGSIVQLHSGEWVTFKVTKILKCELKKYCHKFKTDDNALVSAEWSEHYFTRKVENCEVKRGAFEGIKVKSKPFNLDFTAAPENKTVQVSEKTSK